MMVTTKRDEWKAHLNAHNGDIAAAYASNPDLWRARMQEQGYSASDIHESELQMVSMADGSFSLPGKAGVR